MAIRDYSAQERTKLYKGYNGNALITPHDYQHAYTQAELDEFVKCASDPIYFIKNYVKIVNVDRGLINLDLYSYQEKLIPTFYDNRFTIVMTPRQAGKTTVVVGFVLHYILFNAEFHVGIAANKQAMASEIMSRLKKAYEHLPIWLQQGVKKWDALQIGLGNGSRVTSGATASSAFRGQSFNCIAGDSTVTLLIDGKRLDVPVEILHQAIANSSKINHELNTSVEHDDVFCDELDFDVFREQIHTLLHGTDEQTSGQPGSTTLPQASCDSTLHGWTRGSGSEAILSRTHLRTQTLSEDGGRSYHTPKTVVCTCNACRGTTGAVAGTAMEQPVVCGTISPCLCGENAFVRDSSEIERMANGALQGCVKTGRVRKENIESLDGREEVSRTCEQSQSQSNQDCEDGCCSPGNEANSRTTKTNGESKRSGVEQRIIFDLRATQEHGASEKIQVLTREGFKSFLGVRKTFSQSTIRLVTRNGRQIECTPEHKLMSRGGWVEAKDMLQQDVHIGDGSYDEVISIEDSTTQDVFDLLHVKDNNSFICNELDVKNCLFLDEFAFLEDHVAEEFWTSVYPTITSGQSTKVIVVSTPNGMNLFHRLWTDANNKKNSYTPFRVYWQDVPGRDQEWYDTTRKNIGAEKFEQEFECVAGHTTITVRDTDTGEILTLPIEQVFSNLECV